MDKWYYGSETSNGRKIANPDNLWKKYFTSSKVVAEYRKIYGEPDIIEIRKTFDNVEKCKDWEYKVLLRLNVMKNERWLNQAMGTYFDPITISKANKGNTHRVGKKLSFKHIEAIRKANVGNKHTLGRTFVISEETKKKISKANKGKPKPEHIAKILAERCRERNKISWNKGKSNPKMIGTKFYNNGKEQKMLHPQNVPDGWIKGRIKCPVPTDTAI